METVIRAARLAVGRTLLAAPALPAPAAEQRVDSATEALPPARDLQAELAALRQEIEGALRITLEAEFRAELKRTLDAQHEEARQQGHAAGLAEGRAAAAKETAQHESRRQAQWDQVSAEIGKAHAAALETLQHDIGTLAFAALCRVVGEQAASKEFALGAAQAVCREARIDGSAVARVHSRDLALLAPADGSLPMPDGVSLRLVADDTVALGGCIVDTDAGQFDGSLDTQLRRLHAVLAGGAAAPQRG